MLPLSYDLAADIEKLRSQIKRMSIAEISKEYGVSNDVSKALKLYVEEQERVAVIPDARTFLVEEYVDESGIYNYIFHTSSRNISKRY